MGSLSRNPCIECLENTSTPNAFLLTCRSCNKTWHHRCHDPPVQDSELVTRIKAYNSGDFENGIIGWKCRRCTKGKDKTGPLPQTIALDSRMAVSTVEHPTELVRGQAHAKSTRTKSARSKATQQPTKPQAAPPTNKSEAQALNSKVSNDPLNPGPLIPNHTVPPIQQNFIDLTMSGDEVVQLPSKPEEPLAIKPKSKTPEQLIPSTEIPEPPSPPLQFGSLTSSIPLRHVGQGQPNPAQIIPPTLPPRTNSTPELQVAPPIRQTSPDLPVPPPQPPVVMQEPAQPEPMDMDEIQPKQELDPEPSLTSPTGTPWQTYNLAPFWIHGDKTTPNPWEESRPKQTTSIKTSTTIRKVISSRWKNPIDPEALFNFQSATWLKAQHEKTSSHLS